MKQKILILALSALVCVQFFLSQRPGEVDLTHFKREFEKHQEKIDGLYVDLSKTKADIQRFKLQINEKDSIIINSDKSTFRELSTDFFDRLK
jgi:hypothetical protein